MSVSGTLWNIKDPVTGDFASFFEGESATSGRWGDIDSPEHHGRYREVDDVLLFKGPEFIWAARVDGSRMHGVLTNFSGNGGRFRGERDFSGAAKRGKK